MLTNVFLEVKNETNKDGSGKGQMAAWKVHNYKSSSPVIKKEFFNT